MRFGAVARRLPLAGRCAFRERSGAWAHRTAHDPSLPGTGPRGAVGDVPGRALRGAPDARGAGWSIRRTERCVPRRSCTCSRACRRNWPRRKTCCAGRGCTGRSRTACITCATWRCAKTPAGCARAPCRASWSRSPTWRSWCCGCCASGI